jgi:hypothetical protein
VARRSRVGLLSGETGGRLGNSTRYRTILEPQGWGDELRATFASAGLCWGFICMHRDRPLNFSREGVRFLARLVSHLGDGLGKSLLIYPSAIAPEGDASPRLVELTDELE